LVKYERNKKYEVILDENNKKTLKEIPMKA
jgi:hypothetical protein